MAQRVQIVLTDDLDNTEAAETVVFGLDGVSYDIDLSESNARALREALAPYIAVSRKSGAKRKAAPAKKRAAGGASANEVRAWAQAQGMNVSARGRVSAEVREAYENAHS